MTELLYFPDKEYQKGFDARVIKPREEPKVDYDGYICLDKTLFTKKAADSQQTKEQLAGMVKQPR